ncbi:hypothetical protein [Shouchella clausii]|uniref:hypothetical protein n=1 Tax=Shouchella clausii TaxID=79880 RepID=UPI001C739AD8|nr:hypothetical protein [Shouchella clausii]MBX0320304.1 hypothetical protein [Shouchella clausii]
MTKKVRIKKASLSGYADRVGEIFEVEPFADGYASMDGKYCFEVDDCEDVNDIDELLEITANLTRRVFDLERENKKMREGIRQELCTISDLFHKHNARTDELAASLDEVYLRLGHVETDIDETDEVTEMLIKDIALLEERTRGLWLIQRAEKE